MLLLAVIVTCFAQSLAAPAPLCVCVTDANIQYRNADWELLGHLNSEECFLLNGGIVEKSGTWMELQNVRNGQTAWASAAFLRPSPESCVHVNMTLPRDRRSSFATGPVSDQCLQCICMQDSGCRMRPCRTDDDYNVPCGYFQINMRYYVSCQRPGISWRTCASDRYCSSQCVQQYMHRFARDYNCPMTCESFAREHKGGPCGCHHTTTVSNNYWNAVKGHTGCNNL